jgi:hypothetical protein
LDLLLDLRRIEIPAAKAAAASGTATAKSTATTAAGTAAAKTTTTTGTATAKTAAAAGTATAARLCEQARGNAQGRHHTANA